MAKQYLYRCPGCGEQFEFKKRVTLTRRTCSRCGLEVSPDEIDRQEKRRLTGIAWQRADLRKQQAALRKQRGLFACGCIALAACAVAGAGLIGWAISLPGGAAKHSPTAKPSIAKAPAPKPKDGASKAKAEPTPKDEEDATEGLLAARDLLTRGHRWKGLSKLDAVAEKYPGTRAAREAAEWAAELGKRGPP